MPVVQRSGERLPQHARHEAKRSAGIEIELPVREHGEIESAEAVLCRHRSEDTRSFIRSRPIIGPIGLCLDISRTCYIPKDSAFVPMFTIGQVLALALRARKLGMEAK